MSVDKGGITKGPSKVALCTLHSQAGAWCERLSGSAQEGANLGAAMHTAFTSMNVL